MAKFTVTITGASKLAAITAAREAYNLANAETPIDTDEAYIQFVMDSAVASWDAQHTDPLVQKDRIIAEKDAEISVKDARIRELEAPEAGAAAEKV